MNALKNSQQNCGYQALSATDMPKEREIDACLSSNIDALTELNRQLMMLRERLIPITTPALLASAPGEIMPAQNRSPVAERIITSTEGMFAMSKMVREMLENLAV